MSRAILNIHVSHLQKFADGSVQVLAREWGIRGHDSICRGHQSQRNAHIYICIANNYKFLQTLRSYYVLVGFGHACAPLLCSCYLLRAKASRIWKKPKLRVCPCVCVSADWSWKGREWVGGVVQKKGYLEYSQILLFLFFFFCFLNISTYPPVLVKIKR